VKQNKHKLGLVERRNMFGYVLIAPFVIGFIFFLAIPMIQSIVFSFSDVKFNGNGYILNFIGFKNYITALNVNPDFRQNLIDSLTKIVPNVLLILIFSFFAANILNQKFKGRTISRLIFFLPVIISSGAMLNNGFSDYLNASKAAATAGNVIFREVSYKIFDLKEIFYNAGLSSDMIIFINGAIQSLYTIILMSGVQILVFLAGLQTVSPSLYEAAKVEGATGWEVFWKITFPMVTPLVFVNAFYSIIDTFVSPNNAVIMSIQKTFFVQLQVGYGAAMSWIYFLIVFIFLAILTLLASKRVYYNN